MRLSFKLLLVFLLIISLIGYFTIKIFVGEIKPGIRSATESTLVDTANILAQMAAQDIEESGSLKDHFMASFNQLNRDPIGANVNGHIKNRVEYRVYVTDQKGMVIFDSANKALGHNYSKWNDVYLTLQGKYGARSTKEDPEDPTSSVMYVAAPIKVGGKIVGSLTVAKPNKEMASVILAGEERVKTAGIILIAVALLIGLLFVWWLNHSITQLEKYALRVSEGQKIAVPEMNSPELNTLAQALEKMRAKLEGKAYVEKYVHSLTHELKSPLAAIKGATEILQENPPEQTRQHFLDNISQQSTRMQQLIERMLKQARIESLSSLDVQPVDLCPLLTKVILEKEPQLTTAQIHLSLDNALPHAVAQVDALLIEQAISNLMDNALDFTAAGGEIAVALTQTDEFYQISVQDTGVGIPEFALDKIYERFYSLPRPDKAKSTGLGLSFIREVALLHQGGIELVNIKPHGVRALLQLKKSLP